MVKELSPRFVETMAELLGKEDCQKLCNALSDNPVVSIRKNRFKPTALPEWAEESEPVKWCDNGLYLKSRPNFTLAPQLHSGCFYVQEASSMIYEYIIRKISGNDPLRYADFCAAPGGKTTAAANCLPCGSLIVANEFVARRAQILKENLQKWGIPDVVVTNSDVSRFAQLPEFFDIIAVDAPCSGEGMMRKEEIAVSQWSENLVDQCRELQREILQSAWNTLKPDGFLIFSTCTFNRKENEENIEFICNELGGESVNLDFADECGILPGINTDRFCYRFMPHSTRGEGLFVGVVRKTSISSNNRRTKISKKSTPLKNTSVGNWLKNSDEFVIFQNSGEINAIRKSHHEAVETIAEKVKVIQKGLEIATIKGKDLIPQHALALSVELNPDSFPSVNLDKNSAIAFLRRESVTLPESTPKGYVIVKYENTPLGFVKNLGNRCNNLYPQEWRIRMQNSND